MTTPHISDDLPLLLSGEAGRDVVMDAAEHLRSCPDCQQDLVSAVVAHASLTSAQRFAPEIVASDEQVDTAPTAVPLTTSKSSAPVAAGGALPDLSEVFAKVRGEAAVTAVRPARRRRILVGVAAAAVVAAGTVAVVETGGNSAPAPAAQTVSLRSIQDGPAATATMIGGTRMKIDATSLPKLTGDRQYEVWLTKKDSTTDQPQSVGFIGANRTADLRIPASVIAQYNTVAVSVQKPDQVQFSGVLVVRGKYKD